MVPKKGKSKRVAARQKYKIERKVREHHRKQRREAKDLKLKGIRPPTKKDPGIPNLFPFKEKLLRQAEETKRQEEKQRQSAARRALHSKNRSLPSPFPASDLADLANSAAARADDFDLAHGTSAFSSADLAADAAFVAGEDSEAVVAGTRDNSRKAYYREFRKVVEESDVVLEVLDARDPLGTRTRHIERAILDSGVRKRVVLVLNKIDLVPKEVVDKWLKYLRRDFPTIAFKSSVQQQRNNLARTGKGAAPGSGSGSADTLLQLLKNYSRNSTIRSAITVGVIGFPNVGKSSIINSLKRARVVAAGATPGVTKTTQFIQLDKTVRMVDSPGIVFGKAKDDSDDAEVLLRNCVKVELVEDPVAPVELIVSRCRPDTLRHIYDIPDFVDARDFLVQLARKTGRLRKGGIPDVENAARTVLRDWNGGRIPYYTVPPADTESGSGSEHTDAAVVAAWGKEFELPDVVAVEREALEKSTFLSGKAVQMVGGVGSRLDVDAEAGTGQVEDEGEDEDDEMDDEGSDSGDDGDEMDEDYEDGSDVSED
ncbi:P-loop containing nucleoside triphosphate hydrolase protein [Gonapodya prolifera JEL478]|uniref:p-loop containing nucleoside triphosphate hydrolase protein n=1 Tax=Gonapodya prolifera (strain JEL478) TaxID=1344416 RepID=A0A139AMJ7_GONPJ|nr:P-loop containing nucleoside triphosphate hydrolase protein [Gonapodya prolifera JEL478]|eukprot:KXS17794.1 P-loop containing nucleoside triphosphate hydrolase protein [Gonapodya prolifera JEL478]